MLEVAHLTVELTSGRPVVQDVSLRLAPGAAVGLVGESGSGKTTTALAMLGYARPGMRISAGTVTIQGTQVDLHNERLARTIRGRLVSHVPQDPATNLNPSLRIRSFLNDVLSYHRGDEAGETAVLEALDRMHLPRTQEFARRFPHQISGGQQQRVLIAAALASEPPLVVLDEPTTGLDVVTQARVLEEIQGLHTERGLALVYVSHDLSVISQIADWVAVMYAGRIVEEGPTERLLSAPRHPYTRGLVASVPDHSLRHALHGIPGVAVGLDDRPRGCAFAPRCSQRVGRCETEMPQLEPQGDGRSVRCFEANRTPPLGRREPLELIPGSGEPLLHVENLRAEYKGRRTVVVAADGISFDVARASCVALVGESGSGKTTIARAIAGLHRPTAGRMTLNGEVMAPHAKERNRELRRQCQIIFQNPYESLNPRQRVGEEIKRPAVVLRGMSKRDAEAETLQLLDRVRLPQRTARRFPSELSGGERQRVAIARALAAGPALVICDEITSALDVSVQAAVIELLQQLREQLGLSLLFITHNLGLVTAVADRVLILDGGQICELGTVTEVFTAPQHPRTRELLACTPRLSTFAHDSELRDHSAPQT